MKQYLLTFVSTYINAYIMSFYNEVGELLLGTRLKRLGDKFIQDMGVIYKSLDIEFEAAWFPFVYFLHRYKETSLTNMAAELEITHSAASQMTAILEKKGVVEVVADAEDGRRKLIRLTNFGNDYVTQLLPVWDAMEKCINNMLLKAKEANVLEGLNIVEKELAVGAVSAKVMEMLGRNGEVVIEKLDDLDESDRSFLVSRLPNMSDLKLEEGSHQVAKLGAKVVAVLFVNEIDNHLALDFLELEGVNDRYSVGAKLLNEVLSGKPKDIVVELTNPSNELLQAVISSGYSFKVNRSRI